MILIDERLPETQLHAEVVLHIRQHVRQAVRDKRTTAADLALMFGDDETNSHADLFAEASTAKNPIIRAAEVIARLRAENGVVVLGHDEAHVARCHTWLRARHENEPAFRNIIATDLETLLVLSQAIDLATASAPSDADGAAIPILIEGETGTGKELLAEAIHEIWARANDRNGEIVIAQVAGRAPELISDDLFGHAKGAYTGAVDVRIGLLEKADKSSLLIDEVGDLPRDAQLGLLRFLQAQTFSRLGESESRKVQVRILAATWHDLDKDVAGGTFRLDLLHRLRVGHLRLPPLRERPRAAFEVVPLMLTDLGQKATHGITRSAQEALALHSWPGNLRELNSVLRVALASSGGCTVRLEDLPPALQRQYLKQPLSTRAVGFLSDEFEEQLRTAELIRWRADQIDQDLLRAELPEASPGLVAMNDFLGAIPDQTVEHQRLVQKLRDHVEASRTHRRDNSLVAAWQKIFSAELPADVAAIVASKLDEARRRMEASKVDNDLDELGALLDESPWCRLVDELQALPVLAKQPGGSVIAVLKIFLDLVYSIAPSAGDKIRAILAQGGLPELRKRIFDALKNVDFGDESDIPSANAAAKVAELSRSDWEEIMATYPTQKAAAQALGVDAKTIHKRIKEHGLLEVWKRQRQNAPNGNSARAALPAPTKPRKN